MADNTDTKAIEVATFYFGGDGDHSGNATYKLAEPTGEEERGERQKKRDAHKEQKYNKFLEYSDDEKDVQGIVHGGCRQYVFKKNDIVINQIEIVNPILLTLIWIVVLHVMVPEPYRFPLCFLK
jgi:hypothetical protein